MIIRSFQFFRIQICFCFDNKNKINANQIIFHYLANYVLTFSGLSVKRDISDLSYSASSASATSKAFSSLISLSFFSNASATANNIFFLSLESRI